MFKMKSHYYLQFSQFWICCYKARKGTKLHNYWNISSIYSDSKSCYYYWNRNVWKMPKIFCIVLNSDGDGGGDGEESDRQWKKKLRGGAWTSQCDLDVKRSCCYLFCSEEELCCFLPSSSIISCSESPPTEELLLPYLPSFFPPELPPPPTGPKVGQ